MLSGSPDDTAHHDRPFAALAATLCGLLIGWALQTNHGNLDDRGMVLVTLALGGALLAVISPSVQVLDRIAARLLPWVMGVGLVIQVVLLNVTRPDMLIIPYRHPYPELMRLETFGLLGVAWLSRRPWAWARRWHVPLMVALAVLLGDWALVALHRLTIDLIPLHHEALAALLRGDNPFAVTFQNIYKDEAFYGPGMVVNGRVQFGYDYPPVNLLMALPGMLLGDYRYALVLAYAAAAGLFAKTRPGWRATGGALLFLSVPGVFILLATSWVEPFGVLLLALCVYWTLHRRNWMPVAFGLLAVSKQHMPLLVCLALPALPVWHDRAYGKRMLAIALGAATVVTLPFFLWSPGAFWHSVVEVMSQMPFRPDSLNYAAWFFAMQGGAGVPLGMWIGFVLAGLAGVLVWFRAPRTVAGFCASLGFVYLCFVSVNRQAFYNYYWFIAACMFASAAVSRWDSELRMPGTGTLC